MKSAPDIARVAPGAQPAEGPWNPGLRSPVPRDILPLASLHRPENAFAGLDAVQELVDFTGLARDALVAFRPERLIVHELLVRVAADISVPDGPGSEDLGVHFREITAGIAERHIAPHLPELTRAYEELRARVARLATSEVETRLFPSAPVAAPQASGWLERLGLRRHKIPPTSPPIPRDELEAAALTAWREAAGSADHEERVIYRALARIVAAVRARHGRVIGDAKLLADLATDRAMNTLGGEELGRLIEPLIDAAIEAEGYRRLPAQARAVVMNTKGASASGKSTMRPLQRALAGRIGLDWGEFALVSPDIFRKYLLDYDSLGDAYKYAGMLTGEELAIVDRKLDRYMAEKAARGAMSHLLIDRFRFDSFAPESTERGSNLLTRFGTQVFMFFMVTPPHETVERAWERGLRVGRYKTVDDLLFHNVEAFTGMPELFFTWALDRGKRVRYEFLDNGVPRDERPRTIAFGADGDLVVLDPDGLLDIDRFRKIDVDAKTPEAVYPPSGALAPERNLAFLRDCLNRLDAVNFADPETGAVYLRVRRGTPSACQIEGLRTALAAPRTGAALAAAFPALADGGAESLSALDGESADGRELTLGRWAARGD